MTRRAFVGGCIDLQHTVPRACLARLVLNPGLSRHPKKKKKKNIAKTPADGGNSPGAQQESSPGVMSNTCGLRTLPLNTSVFESPPRT